MNRLPALAAVATAALVAAASLGTSAWAQTSAAPPKAKKAAAKPAAKPARVRHVAKAAPQARPAAASLALAAEAAEELSASQLAIAARVLTGRADCEFNQTIDVSPLDGKPGHFSVEFKKVRYTMVPEETTTGAVRLFDRKAGVMWLQIPVKSMLLNSKIGQRMVDACTLNLQRAAATATVPVVSSLTP